MEGAKKGPDEKHRGAASWVRDMGSLEGRCNIQKDLWCAPWASKTD